MRPYCLGVSPLLLGHLPVEHFRGGRTPNAQTTTPTGPSRASRYVTWCFLPPTLQVSFNLCTPRVHLWYTLQGSLVPSTPMRDMLCLEGIAKPPKHAFRAVLPTSRHRPQTYEVGGSPVFL